MLCRFCTLVGQERVYCSVIKYMLFYGFIQTDIPGVMNSVIHLILTHHGLLLDRFVNYGMHAI